MPAPRYVNELQENALWVSLASLWAGGGCLAWLASLGSETPWLGSSSALTLWAVLAVVVSVALRLPILTSPPSTSQRSDHAVWLLSLFAMVNWLGCLLLQASHWSEVLPPLILLMTGEVWFHVVACRLGVLPWCRQGLLSCYQCLAGLGVDPTSSVRQTLQSEASTMAIEDCATTHADGVERSSVQGSDEQGRRYFSGDITVALAAKQTSESLPVSFCPPFTGQPQVDFECEADEVTVQLIHSSPAGMRLGVKRSNAQDPLVFQLQWYATEVELDQASVAAAHLP